MSMHELNATQEIINILSQTCTEKDIRAVKVVKLAVGVLTTYEKAPFVQYYDLLKKEVVALEKSVLEVTMVPGKILCADCKKESLISSEIELVCKECGSVHTKMIAGNDVKIRNLKI